MSRVTRRILTSDAFCGFLYRFIRAYSATFRFEVAGEKPWIGHLEAGGGVLLCTWHQQFFAAIGHFKTYARFNPSLMISKSKDGAIIAGVARRSGWVPVLGSSSRGGAEALRGMIEALRTNRLAGHVVDGPRGPAGRVKAGLVRLAQEADAVVVPFFTEADRAWYIDSWDNFMMPRPFTKVRLVFLDMIRIEPTSDPDEFEAQRLMIEGIMRPHLKGRLAAT